MSNNKRIKAEIRTNNYVIVTLIKDPGSNSEKRVKELEQRNENLRSELKSNKK